MLQTRSKAYAADRTPPSLGCHVVEAAHSGVGARDFGFSNARSGGRRLTGLFLAIAVHVVAASLFLLQSHSHHVEKAPAPLSMFNIAPPAAPPEPVSEVPPGPEQVEQPRVKIQPPRIEPPAVTVPSANHLSLDVGKKAPDPGPAIEKMSAPEARPTPPAPQPSNARPTWEGMVLGALNKVKRYPREAAFRRQQGVPYIRFVIDREGKLLSSRLDRSSGVRALDEEAVGLPRRAQPLPRPPEEVRGDSIELIVPVEFFLR